MSHRRACQATVEAQKLSNCIGKRPVTLRPILMLAAEVGADPFLDEPPQGAEVPRAVRGRTLRVTSFPRGGGSTEKMGT